MSACMLTATIAVPAGTTPNFAAAHLLLEGLRQVDLFNFEDPETLAEQLLDDLSIVDSSGNLLLPIAKRIGHQILDNLEEALDGDEVNTLEVAGYQLFIAGGLSSGAAPTTAAQAIWHAACLPGIVLKAAGFMPDISKPLSRANGSTVEPTDTDVLDALSLGLGTKPEWSGAGTLEWVANTIGRVRPHPGDADPYEYLEDFRDTHGGFDPLEDPYLEGFIDVDDITSESKCSECGETGYDNPEDCSYCQDQKDACECSESYRNRGEHTPGCPADTGEREVDGEQINLCDCCAMKLANGDDSACRDFYNHTHASLEAPLGTALTDGPFEWDQCHRSLTCDGHSGENGEPAEITYGQKFWHGLKP